MRLTRQTSHAIRILIHCARAPDELIKVAEIADQLGITQQNVFKIVHLLARAGFLQAMRGRYGGVRLAREPRAIRIGEVVRAMEIMDVALDDETPRERISGHNQLISRVLDDALEAFISILDQHTLEDMAQTGRNRSHSDKPRTKAPRRARRGSSASRKGQAAEIAFPDH